MQLNNVLPVPVQETLFDVGRKAHHVHERTVDKWKAQSQNIDWDSLVVSISRDEIAPAVYQLDWQAFRFYLKGTDMDYRFKELKAWLTLHGDSRTAQVQVANYVTALKRGGMWR